jgi:F-type H+-transporting ATPase subunit a
MRKIVNRIGKILLWVTLWAGFGGNGALAAIAGAKPDSGAAVLAPVAPTAETIFNFFGVPVTNAMICTWVVVALIILIVRLTTWQVKEIPTRGQNIMEAIFEGWESLMGNVLEPKVVRWVFPFATTFFLFIVISNLMDLVPGVGSIGWGVRDATSSLPFALEDTHTPLLRPPTIDVNLTSAMALVFFILSLYWGVRYNGFFGLVKHVFGVKVATNKWGYLPLFLLFLFIGVMESFSILFIRPVALALRLYGNIFGGETMLTMAMTQKSVLLAALLALPGYFFELVVCLLQAFVFAMLSVAFVGTLCSHSDEEHSH